MCRIDLMSLRVLVEWCGLCKSREISLFKPDGYVVDLRIPHQGMNSAFAMNAFLGPCKESSFSTSSYSLAPSDLPSDMAMSKHSRSSGRAACTRTTARWSLCGLLGPESCRPLDELAIAPSGRVSAKRGQFLELSAENPGLVLEQ